MRRSIQKQRGIATVEGAIVLSVQLLLLFVILDLGLAVFRYNTLADAARQLARSTIMHGSKSPLASGSWGPSEFVAAADDDSPIVQETPLVLATMPEADVEIRIIWPDEDNRPNDRVRVAVTYQHQSIGATLVGYGGIELQGVSTMCIVQ